jgi:hypothetical protein
LGNPTRTAANWQNVGQRAALSPDPTVYNLPIQETQMEWPEIREAYPNKWLVIEALAAHTTATKQRQLDRIAVVERCADGTSAMQSYRRLHQQ